MKKVYCYLALVVGLISPELRASSNEKKSFLGVHFWNTPAPLKEVEQAIKQAYTSKYPDKDDYSLHLSLSEYKSLTHAQGLDTPPDTHTIAEVETVLTAWVTNLLEESSTYKDINLVCEIPASPVNEHIDLPADAPQTRSEFLFFSQYTFSQKSIVSAGETNHVNVYLLLACPAQEVVATGFFQGMLTGTTVAALAYPMLLLGSSSQEKKKLKRTKRVGD